MANDLTPTQWRAALAKYGMRDHKGPFGHIGVTENLWVSPPRISRRQQLAWLLARQSEERKRESRWEATRQRMEELIGGRQEGDRYNVRHDGEPFVTIHKIENLPLEHAAEVVLLLRRLRGTP